MSLPESTPLIEFRKSKQLNTPFCKINYEFPIYQPESFGHYRADAKRVLRIIRGEQEEGDLEAVTSLQLNAVGVDVLFAAIAYELLEG